MTNSRPSRPRNSRISRSYSTGRQDSDKECSKNVDAYLEQQIVDARRNRNNAKNVTDFQYENGRVNALKEAQIDLIRKGSRNPTKYVLTKK